MNKNLQFSFEYFYIRIGIIHEIYRINIKKSQQVHGFDAISQEIIEEVTVTSASKKLVAIDRILSISKKFILIKYAYERVIYWEYLEEYSKVKARIS